MVLVVSRNSPLGNASGDLQMFHLDPVAADLRKLVPCLLHKPAVFGSSKNLG